MIAGRETATFQGSPAPLGIVVMVANGGDPPTLLVSATEQLSTPHTVAWAILWYLYGPADAFKLATVFRWMVIDDLVVNPEWVLTAAQVADWRAEWDKYK